MAPSRRAVGRTARFPIIRWARNTSITSTHDQPQPAYGKGGPGPSVQGHAMNVPANLAEKLTTFTERFSPRTVAVYNDNDIMVAKLEGPYHWHKHDDTDDFFLVLRGTLDIELRDRTIRLNPGEVFVVPKGVEHRPVAHGEVHILLIEPTGTPNSGDKATAAPRILA